jgi:3-oxoacyl-(acyl-carrier-protein) synthase
VRSKDNLLGGSAWPVAITGCGATSAAGAGVEALAAALREKRRCLQPLERLRGPPIPMSAGGEVPPECFRETAGARVPRERAFRLASSALDEALAAARLDDTAAASRLDDGLAGDRSRGGAPEDARRPRASAIGLALGTALGAIEAVEEWVAAGEACESAGAAEGPRPLDDEMRRRASFDGLAARLAAAARPPLRGPRSVFSVTCVSGLCALEQAAADLARARAARVAVCAFDTLSRFMQAGFSALGALSPSGRLQPFTLGRDGIVLGEAAAAAVLEPLAAARARGADVHGCLLGARLESDAHHLTSPEPSGKGMRRAIERALQDSGLGSGDIGCITVTAAGSPLYDRMLSRAVREALGDAAVERIPVTTWEPAVGHVLAATSIMALVHAALVLREARVLPVFDTGRLDPDCRLRYVIDGPEPLASPAVLALIVGFGGQNGAAVVAAPEVAADLALDAADRGAKHAGA